MENWFIYAILASLSWGTYIVISKIATKGLNSYVSGVVMALAIVAVFVVLFVIKSPKFEGNWISVTAAIVAGMLWAIGMYFALSAMEAGADVSKLVPIYNTNTLVAVLLGIILLKELPIATEMIRVIAGAILIVIGAILVST